MFSQMFLDTYFWRFPLSLLAAVCLLFLLAGIYIFFRNSKPVTFFLKKSTSISSICTLILLMLIEGFSGYKIHATWIFAFWVLFFLSCLGLVTLNRLFHLKKTKRDIFFLLNHGGLFLIAWVMFFGAPDRERLKIIVDKNNFTYEAYDEGSTLHILPFGLKLHHFEMPLDSLTNTPVQFRSELLLFKNKETKKCTIEVNNPYFFDGYFIYQDSFDETSPTNPAYVTIQVVKDRWLWIMYVGFASLLLGSAGLLLTLKR